MTDDSTTSLTETGPRRLDRAVRLLRFLELLQQQRSKPVRDVESYRDPGQVLWFGQMPDHPAVNPATNHVAPPDDAPILTIQRVHRVDPPRVPPILEPWIPSEQLRDPESDLMVRDEIIEQIIEPPEPGEPLGTVVSRLTDH